jgi:Zn-dependent protease with chaperone function
MNRRKRVPTPAIVRRERSHRRAVLLGLGVLLLLGTSPVLGHHLPIGLEQHLAGHDHLWALCLVALHLIMAPVHGIFHLLFFAGLAYAIRDRARAWRTQHGVLAALESRGPVPGDAFWRAAAAVGMDPASIRVVEGLPSPAFTAGWVKPQVYVARALAERLSPAELEAVLAHEASHAERRDPLRLSLLRFLSCMLFWLPAVHRLTEDIADEAEIRADDHASRDRPLELATAILTLAQWTRPPAALHDGVGFDDRDLLERRVRRLAGEDVTPRSRVTRRSILGAALALSLAWTSGVALAHPLPSDVHDHPEHCEQHGAAAVFHLFCLGFSSPRSHQDCPHGRDP